MAKNKELSQYKNTLKLAVIQMLGKMVAQNIS